MDVILYFGGGGSLGAFDAGVWAALAPRLQAANARLVAVAGASIGAVNAACVARHAGDDDLGVEALRRLWRDELATPSVPFNGPLAWLGDRDARSWNGVLTGLLVGNRRLYRTEHAHWNPLVGLSRPLHPLMDRRGEWRWLQQRLGDIPQADARTPLLCVVAVDVLAGTQVLFDNARAALPVRALAASSAIPLLFDPVEIDGRLHWDGEMTRESALPGVAARVQAHRGDAPAGGTLLVAVDHMSQMLPRAPASDLEIADRVLELLLAGKARVDVDALAGVDRLLRIEREPQPHDGISGQFDYSPERIAELVEQGAAQAARAWDAAGLPATTAAPGAATHAHLAAATP